MPQLDSVITIGKFYWYALMNILGNIYVRLPMVKALHALLVEARQNRAIQANRYCQDLLINDPRFLDARSLAKYEHQVFSQSGEDGVIREIFNRVGTTNQYFVEFGSENGLENNTRFLLQQGWKGCWMDGNKTHISMIHKYYPEKLRSGQLKALCAKITAENICSLFDSLIVPKTFDLLSIDIDGNDYWIWKSLESWRPRVVIIEYNGHYPSDYEWVMPYDANHRWDGTMKYGASLKSLELLAKSRGYDLVYCNLVGTNAFFIRNDLVADNFSKQDNAEYHFQPFRPYLVTSMMGYSAPVTLTSMPD